MSNFCIQCGDTGWDAQNGWPCNCEKGDIIPANTNMPLMHLEKFDEFKEYYIRKQDGKDERL